MDRPLALKDVLARIVALKRIYRALDATPLLQLAGYLCDFEELVTALRKHGPLLSLQVAPTLAIFTLVGQHL